MNAVCLAMIALVAQDAPPKRVPAPQHPKVDQERVDQAIEKGCKWMLSNKADITKEWPAGHKRYQAEPIVSHLELVVLTLAHSGFYFVEEHPEFKELVDLMVSKEIVSTYRASIQAMALQKIDPKKYQWRIAQCAQVLIDNQCQNGQWDYGEKTKTDHIKPPPPPKEEPPTIATKTEGAAGGEKPKPWREKFKSTETQSIPKLPVTPQREPKQGPIAGDNSNSQYAAIGLRACIDAGIVIPHETLKRAREWWVKCQNKDGGWGYNGSGTMHEYDGGPTTIGNTSYGSMTVGAVGALCIYDKFLGHAWKNDAAVVNGYNWIARNFDVTANPKKTWMYLYYLYGLERAGILYGSEFFGKHEWYPAGANHLLDTQKPSGAWEPASGAVNAMPDTCFAILFLRRGTAPLNPPKISTGEAKPKK